MKNSYPIAIIGGYDLIARSFYSKVKSINKNSIFINIQNKKISGKNIFNFKIFQLKKILQTLERYKIKNLLFLGKISRPNLSKFKNDGVVERYIPLLINSYKQGDGNILKSILKIFIQNGFNVLSPKEISKSFFLSNDQLETNICEKDKLDFKKSIKLLNDLSKYDNAQAIVCVNGYIIAIEAAEGTDELLTRVIYLRKNLDQLKIKSGLLTKIPKKNQSEFIDLPVVGLQTLKLVKKANLNGIAINPKLTIIHNKNQFLKYAKEKKLIIYNVL